MRLVTRPLKLAIVGGGPSAFYAASRVLSQLPRGSAQGDNLEVHIYDKLWAPHGLVRYGVAPDHPEVKNCIHKFDSTASDPRFRFFGNVSISSSPLTTLQHSRKISLQDLFPHYSHLLLSFGAGTPQPLPAAVEHTTALSLVHWYTGHPSNAPPPALHKIKHLTLIGHGNVSLDIARIFLSPPSVLSKLDIPEHILEIIRESSIEHISIVSRRGPGEAAFTAKELRELLNLPNATLLPISPELLITPAGASRQQSRILDLLRKGSVPKGASPSDARKATWSLEFFRSPLSTGKDGITYAINELDEQKRPRPTGGTEIHKTDLVVGSVGFRSEAFHSPKPWADTTITTTTTVSPLPSNPSVLTSSSTTVVAPEDPWFDAQAGRVRNVQGQVVDMQGDRVQNVYTSGWASNGAKGVLATTMYDAYSVADTIISDHLAAEKGSEDGVAFGARPMGMIPKAGPPESVVQGLEGRGTGRVISYEQWKKIDAEEGRRGKERGKERERMQWEEVDAFLS